MIRLESDRFETGSEATVAPGATERNEKLGHVLREARKAAGSTQHGAAKVIGCSQPTINRIETGVRATTPAERDALLAFYDAPQEMSDEIDRLCSLPDMAIPTGRQVPSKLVEMVKAAATADELLSFQSERIPLQLQSDQFTLVQYKSAEVQCNETDVLRGRNERCGTFLTEQRLYHAILTESSVQQAPGGLLTIVREQALHLLKLLELHPRFTLQILPTPAALPYIATDFTVLKMPEKQPDLMYEPHGATGSLVKDKQLIVDAERYWRQARQVARTPEETKKYLHELTQH